MARWEQFQREHVLNPETTEAAGYENWNRVKWNAFLRERLGNAYGKGLNSVIIATPEAVLDAFRNTTAMHGDNYWTDRKLPVYLLNKNSYDSEDKYDVYNLGSMYILAALEERRPVHLPAQNTTQVPSGQQPQVAYGKYPKIN